MISVLFVVVLVLVGLGLTMGASTLASRLVCQRHRDLESIVEGGHRPSRWRVACDRRITMLRPDPTNSERVARLCDEAQPAHQRRLDGLSRCVQASQLADPEETRQILLGKLSAAREAWERDGELDS